MSQLDRWLLRHPKTVSAGCGLLVGLTMLALSVGVLVAQLRNEMLEGQTRQAQAIFKVANENRNIIARLQGDYTTECSSANLARLNRLLFGFSEQSDIGLYDKSGLMYCTARIGRLAIPIADPPVTNYSADGDPMWFNVPTPAGGERSKALVVRRGDFSVAMSPRTIVDLSAASDVVWIGKSREPVKVRYGIPPAALEYLKAAERADTYGWKALWMQGVGVSLIKVEGTLVRIANSRPLSDALIDNPGLSALLFVLSCAVGVLVTYALRPRIVERTSLKRMLPRLLKPGNVRCVYQPVIELATGRPAGCEVLVRLQREDELLYPDGFVGLVQELGLGWRLDSLVIETALRELATLGVPNGDFSVAFNLFPSSVRHEQVHALFQDSRAWAGPLAGAVVIGLEVTEYHFSEALIPELKRLRAAGYHIAVDDFGTGY
ncbi:MAG TPA: EAL domain-containing protein, partial [Rhodocyclaceae bacterium]|nr:EAL domain-containing protein [Rhodocyclaceae bacterium]